MARQATRWGQQVTAGISAEPRISRPARGSKIRSKIMEHREGAIRLPKAGQWTTCKPLKTIARHNFISKRPRALEGYETDCNLGPQSLGIKVHRVPKWVRISRISGFLAETRLGPVSPREPQKGVDYRLCPPL